MICSLIIKKMSRLSSLEKQPCRSTVKAAFLQPILKFVVWQRPRVAVVITSAGEEDVSRSCLP